MIEKAETAYEKRQEAKEAALTEARMRLAHDAWDAIGNGSPDALIYQRKETSNVHAVKLTDAFLDFLHNEEEMHSLIQLLSDAKNGQSVHMRASAFLARFVGYRAEMWAEDYME